MEKLCDDTHTTCAFYGIINSVHCGSCRHRVDYLKNKILKIEEEKQDLIDIIKEIIKITDCNACDEITGVLLLDHIQYIMDEYNKIL